MPLNDALGRLARLQGRGGWWCPLVGEDKDSRAQPSVPPFKWQVLEVKRIKQVARAALIVGGKP